MNGITRGITRITRITCLLQQKRLGRAKAVLLPGLIGSGGLAQWSNARTARRPQVCSLQDPEPHGLPWMSSVSSVSAASRCLVSGLHPNHLCRGPCLKFMSRIVSKPFRHHRSRGLARSLVRKAWLFRRCILGLLVRSLAPPFVLRIALGGSPARLCASSFIAAFWGCSPAPLLRQFVLQIARALAGLQALSSLPFGLLARSPALPQIIPKHWTRTSSIEFRRLTEEYRK